MTPPRTILLDEFCCAVGLGIAKDDPLHCLYREGKAMRDSLARDFAAAGCEVLTLDGEDGFEDFSLYNEMVDKADHVLVVAPELENNLSQRISTIPAEKLLNSSVSATELTSDKWTLYQHWQSQGIPTPETVLGNGTVPFPSTVVVKRRDGAGSIDAVVLDDWQSATRAHRTPKFIVQPYHFGRSASMAFLIGPKQTLGLAPCWQLISHKGTLAYEGGTCPIHPDYAERVARIATPAVRSVPGLAGYVGVDVILGEAANGSEDVVIEINPRVTTSYLGLSALCIHNLASVWLSLHVGNEVPPLLWHEGVVAYFPNGTIRKLENFSSSTEGSLPKM